MKKRNRAENLILKILALILSVNFLVAAEPFENLPDDSLLFEVLGQKVFFEDIEPASDLKKKQQEISTLTFELWLKQARLSNIGRYFKPLWEEYVKENGLVVTEQEIEQYNEKMDRFRVSLKKRSELKRINLIKELKAENLSGEKRAEYEKSLNLLNRILEMDYDPNSAEQKQIDDAAKSYILQCKINQQLYKQYKGRVIFQQAGPEPLDAYKQFLEGQQSKGNFKFYNKEAEDLFWNYWRETKHTFFKDPNEVERSMTTPWWLQEMEDDYYGTEAEWGQEVKGFQIRINAGLPGRVIYPGKIPTFKIDLLNTGNQTFSCIPLEQFFEVEVDGDWYKWTGPDPCDIVSVISSPKTVQYDFFNIPLKENWILKDLSKEENKTLILSPGIHIIRIKYQAIAVPESPVTEVISNPLKFQIIAPKSK